MTKILQILFFICFSFLSISLKAQELDSTMWVVDGTVSAIVRDSNTIFLGGNFNYVYPNTGGGATINLSDGRLSNEDRFPQVNGVVYVSLPDGKGGWFIGGNFTMVYGIKRIGLAHILADNSLDTNWNPDIQPFGSVIACMAIHKN